MNIFLKSNTVWIYKSFNILALRTNNVFLEGTKFSLLTLLSKRLIEEGVYAKAIVFPTVPQGTGRVRNMLTAAHTMEMLDRALSIYEKVGKEMNIIS